MSVASITSGLAKMIKKLDQHHIQELKLADKCRQEIDLAAKRMDEHNTEAAKANEVADNIRKILGE